MVRFAAVRATSEPLSRISQTRCGLRLKFFAFGLDRLDPSDQIVGHLSFALDAADGGGAAFAIDARRRFRAARIICARRRPDRFPGGPGRCGARAAGRSSCCGFWRGFRREDRRARWRCRRIWPCGGRRGRGGAAFRWAVAGLLQHMHPKRRMLRRRRLLPESFAKPICRTRFLKSQGLRRRISALGARPSRPGASGIGMTLREGARMRVGV